MQHAELCNASNAELVLVHAYSSLADAYVHGGEYVYECIEHCIT